MSLAQSFAEFFFFAPLRLSVKKLNAFKEVLQKLIQ